MNGTAVSLPRSRSRRLCLLLILLVSAPAAGFAAGGSSGTQETARLSLSAAPVEIVFPADRPAWGRRLATYADAAAGAYAEILGLPVPAGRIVWEPSSAARGIGRVEVDAPDEETPPTLRIDAEFNSLARDSGVAHATGSARWLVGYAVGRLYFARRAAPDAWWDDGAALYLTDLLARRERATTPALYGLESAWTRVVRRGQPVDLRGEERGTPAAAVRGKAYLTFRLLEAIYGQQTVVSALASLSTGGFQGLFRTAMAAALPAGLDPDPQTVLTTWLDPQATIDLSFEDVEVREQSLRMRIGRDTPVPVPVRGELRLANGERRSFEAPAGTGAVEIEEAISAAPVELRLDPEGLLPELGRGNNRYGFGDASRVRSFFPLDERVVVGELRFEGEIELVDRRRVEEFTLALENLTEEPMGIGMLVSAQWIDRPIARTQRAVFLVVPPGERRVARDFLAYPRLGRGRARVEARYWRAADPEDLTERILAQEPDLINSYIILRDPPATASTEASPLARLQERLRVDSVAELAQPPGDPVPPGAIVAPPGGEGAAQPSAGAAPLDLRITSPAEGTLPVTELTFEADVSDRRAVVTVDLFVNEELVATLDDTPYRARWTPDEQQDVFVLRAVATGRDGTIATATRVLERGRTTFGGSVDLVTVYATVKGAGGTLVHDLAASDFLVVEDGTEQEIELFASGEQTAVSVALLLDTSSSMIGGGIASARAGARRLVDSLVQDTDRAMVLGFNDKLYLYSDFVSDREQLDRAIEATYPDGSTALYDGLVESLRKVNRRSGRRALVVLSDGLDTRSRFDYADVLEYVRQSDVIVYTIGLQLMHDATELGDATGAVKDSVENLRALAEVTGGAAFFPLQLEELEEIYGQIAAELEGQYALSYYPTNQEWEGQWRTLEVRLPGRTALSVRHRPGYYGVRPDTR